MSLATSVLRSLQFAPSTFIRRTSTMASVSSPAFTQRVVQAMRSLYPEELADRAWDNVGLLQDNVAPASGDVPRRVLLTNDLTERVAEEAVKKGVSVIVSYHPFIFRGLKSITTNEPHQRIILRLAQANIAVYSPHTAVDAAPSGLNDWLADILPSHNIPLSSRSIAQPLRTPAPPGFEQSGYGRLLTLSQPTSLSSIVKAYASGLGSFRHVIVSPPHNASDPKEALIRSVAVCAGSGADVFKDVDADCYVTGEMSHHVALRLGMLGKAVVMVLHSNSERGYLKGVMKPRLEELLKEEGAEVIVSEEDRDPFEIWDVSEL